MLAVVCVLCWSESFLAFEIFRFPPFLTWLREEPKHLKLNLIGTERAKPYLLYPSLFLVRQAI